MATGEAGGYDLDFVDPVPDALICLICTCAAKDAQQVTCCGRVFCKDCLGKLSGNSCPQCRQSFTSFPDARGEREVLSLKVKCSNTNNGCLWRGELGQLNDHIARKCWHKIVTCKFAKIGCDKTFYRKDIQEHEANKEQHLDLAMTTILKQEEQILRMKSSIPNTNPATAFTFKLSQFTEHKKSEKVFFSHPFYSSPNGYKFCILVDANGDGDCKNTHISVFACLMKGDNDDSLTWPFTGTVDIRLLNTLEDKNHKEYTISNFPAASERASGRVVDGERGLGCGIQKFILHTELRYNASSNCQYLNPREDTLYFRVLVNEPQKNKPWLDCTA